MHLSPELFSQFQHSEEEAMLVFEALYDHGTLEHFETYLSSRQNDFLLEDESIDGVAENVVNFLYQQLLFLHKHDELTREIEEIRIQREGLEQEHITRLTEINGLLEKYQVDIVSRRIVSEGVKNNLAVDANTLLPADTNEQNPEFRNLYFEEQKGWTVITLDPTKLNKYMLKKALFLITSHFKIVLVKHLGYPQTLNVFTKELLPYIFASWELLEVLDLVKPLLTILLERPRLQVEYKKKVD